MTTYTATFSTGETITRNSDNTYAFAWALIRIEDGKIINKGFSADRHNAAKAAQSQMWSGVSARNRKNPALRRYHARIAKDKGFATVQAWFDACEAVAADRNAGHRIEIVEVA
jgi:hypothetical protein